MILPALAETACPCHRLSRPLVHGRLLGYAGATDNSRSVGVGMPQEEHPHQFSAAASDFDQHEHRTDGMRIVDSLNEGLTLLRELLYLRLHKELEKVLGVDSMLTPISEIKTRQQVKTEIELYQAAESASAVVEMAYARNDGHWYLHWLAGIRLGQAALDEQHCQRLVRYAGQDLDHRRLTLTNVLVAVLPEARRAPLVLFRLFPLAVHVATAIAFGDEASALRIRASQTECLPAIEDCTQCRGQVLNNGNQCTICGNPLWKTTWLMIA